MNTYKNLIFTNHAFDRLSLRSITQDAIWQTINYPEKKYPQDQTIKFIKSVQDRRLHVIASWLAKENKWLVVSVWVRGEEDQEPVIWQLITLPFKLIWWLIKKLV